MKPFKRLAKKILYALGWVDTLGKTQNDSYEIFLVKSLLRSGDICADIGANTGEYVKVIAERVGEQGKVYAFEPAPKTFSSLKSNIENWRLKNVISLQKAVSNRLGTADFTITFESGLSGLGDTGRGTVVEKQQVDLVTLDNYLDSVGSSKMDFLKIDVEGYEGSVIEGARRTLENNPNLVIMTELDERNFSAHYFDRKKVFEFMQNLGYEARVIDREKKKLLPINGEVGGVNFLFFRPGDMRMRVLEDV